MAGKTLVLAVLLPFAALVAIGTWLTREGPVAEAPADDAPAQAALEAAPSPPAPSPLGSNTPVGDALTQALVEARREEQAPAPAVREVNAPEDVKVAIAAATPLLRQCFEDLQGRYPGTQDVVLGFVLDQEGGAGYFREPEVSQTTIPDPYLEACILEAMADAKFPPPRGGDTVQVKYPFTYSPAVKTGR